MLVCLGIGVGSSDMQEEGLSRSAAGVLVLCNLESSGVSLQAQVNL